MTGRYPGADPAAAPAPGEPDPGAPDASGPAPRRRRWPRRVGAAVAVVVVALVVAVATVGVGGDGEEGPAEPSGLPPATAEVVTTDLVQAEHVSGTVTYGEAHDVAARASSGTITWLPAEGTVVALGQPVYQVDAKPVVLLHGAVPAYRTLHQGVVGPDVTQLEEALVALGHPELTVDDTYTWATAAAVMAWQADLGVEQTGTVDPDEVVVAPGDIRVATTLVSVGDALGGAPNEPVLSYTGTSRVVTVALDVALQHLVEPGTQATVTLLDGSEVVGTVAQVSSLATTPAPEGEATGAGGGGEAPEPTTVDVTITVPGSATLGALEAAPVDVSLEADRREDVLAVPVGALVALAEGGHGVQVVDGDQVTYVPVETGLFADGLVEVSGDGVAAGTVVGAPA